VDLTPSVGHSIELNLSADIRIIQNS